MATRLQDVTQEIAQKSAELHAIFEEAGADLDLARVKSLTGDTTARAAEIKRRNDELSALGEERDSLQDLARMAQKAADTNREYNLPGVRPPFPGADAAKDGGSQGERKSLRQLFAESKAFEAVRNGVERSGRVSLPDMDAKTLITLSTVSPQNQRIGMQPMIREERTIIDLMNEGQLETTNLEYYEQTTFTNAAAETAETSTKPEGALAWTLRSATARDIAWWIPLTKQAVRDNGWLEAAVRGELMTGIRRREETQVLTGDGNAPNLRGILNLSGLQTQAKGSDPVPDAVYKAMQLVRGAAGSGFAEPTAAVFHPNDWTDIKLLRTADGVYIWGNPSEDGPDRIWSLPVRQTTAMTENTAIVGAFRPYAYFLRRGGIDIILSTEHSTYVIENKVLLLAEEQAVFLCTRASAFASVTGI